MSEWVIESASTLFRTKNDDKKEDTEVAVTIYARNPRLLLAHSRGQYGRFKDRTEYMAPAAIVNGLDITPEMALGGEVTVEFMPDGNDEWHVFYTVYVNFLRTAAGQVPQRVTLVGECTPTENTDSEGAIVRFKGSNRINKTALR